MLKNIFSNLTNTQKSINREEYFTATIVTLLGTSLAAAITIFQLSFLFVLMFYVIFLLLNIQRINDTKLDTVTSLIILGLSIPLPFLMFIILMFIKSNPKE